MDQSTAVCVIGPARVGTSLTMRVLNLIGVDVGPLEGLVGPGPGGPRGFWERLEIIRLNDRLLRSQGGSWRTPPPLPPGWEAAPELEPRREQARELLARTFGDSELWGWKDPRVSLTAAFWLDLVPSLRFVICLRNPIDAVDSLAPPTERRPERAFYYSRQGVEGERAYRLWATYLSRALANTAGRPRLIVSYDEYFDDLRAVAERLARFVDRDPPRPGGAGWRTIEDFVDPGLRHYRTHFDEVLADGRLPGEVAELYRQADLLRRSQAGAASASLEHDAAAARGR